MSIPNSLQTQVGGDHYKKYKVQPLEFAEKIGLSPIMFCVFKYLVRYKDKNKVEDLKKALHCIDVFVECGKEKNLCIETSYLKSFISQFPTLQAKGILELLKLQTDRSRAERVKTLIERLVLNEVLANE